MNMRAPINLPVSYFLTLTAHRGEILHFKNVFGPKTRKETKSVWRVWVRIRTTEGWMLMGYIGEKDTEAELPKVQRGDRVELDPIALSDWKRSHGKDERPKDFSRQLHGRIIRTTKTPVSPLFSVAVGHGREQAQEREALRDSFDCPKVWSLRSPCDTKCVAFIPNVFIKSEDDNDNRTRFGMVTFYRDTTEANPVWRWQGTSWLTKKEASDKWEKLVERGYAGKFDMISNPLNKDDRHPADRYATIFSGQTNTFVQLVRTYHDFPRKKVKT